MRNEQWTRRLSLWATLGTMLLLQACETVPVAPPQTQRVCPRVPDLVLEDVPEQDWLGLMESFLRGTLSAHTDYKLPSAAAKLSTTK